MSWRPIKDNIIIHRWRCVKYGEDTTVCGIAEISPDWYQQNGTPVCVDCDRDMEYVETLLDCNFDPIRETLVVKQERKKQNE